MMQSQVVEFTYGIYGPRISQGLVLLWLASCEMPVQGFLGLVDEILRQGQTTVDNLCTD